MKRSRRRLLKLCGAAAGGGAFVYLNTEGVPASVGGFGDPLTQSYPMSRVFSEIEWDESGQLAITINNGHDVLGVSVTRENDDPVYGAIDTAGVPRNGGTGVVDVSSVVGEVESLEMHALGGSLEQAIDPEIVSTETVDIPDL